jgi:TPR repeat protein
MVMRQRVFFSLLVLASLIVSVPSLEQSARSHQDESKRISTHWTAAAEKRLLTKARQGDASSQMWLGAVYEQGWFGETNIAEALKWFRRAAAQGDPDAQFSLGQMYEDGEGVQQNYTLAAKWYRLAAEHVPNLGGAGQGRNHLGLLYMQGLGVPKDYVQAYLWFRLANVETNLSYAKKHMTPAQVLEAERFAAEWKSQHNARE